MTGWVIQLLVAAGVVQGQPEVIVLPPAPGVVEKVSPLPKSSVSSDPSTSLRILVAERPKIDAWIEQYAQEYGVSAETLRYMAKCESTFNPRAVNGPYAGMYQYSASSWISNRKAMGEDSNHNLRFDAQEAIKTTAYILSTRGDSMWPNCVPKE